MRVRAKKHLPLVYGYGKGPEDNDTYCGIRVGSDLVATTFEAVTCEKCAPHVRDYGSAGESGMMTKWGRIEHVCERELIQERRAYERVLEAASIKDKYAAGELNELPVWF